MPDDIEETELVEETPPLDVRIVKPKKDYSIYDSYDDPEYDEHIITEDEIKEAQDGNSPTKET